MQSKEGENIKKNCTEIKHLTVPNNLKNTNSHISGTVTKVRLVQYPSGYFLRQGNKNIFKLGKISKEKAEQYLKSWNGNFLK